MVTPYVRRRADSGNMDRHTNVNYKCQERWGNMVWKMLYLSNSSGLKNRLEMLPVLRMGVQGPLYQDNSNNM